MTFSTANVSHDTFLSGHVLLHGRHRHILTHTGIGLHPAVRGIQCCVQRMIIHELFQILGERELNVLYFCLMNVIVNTFIGVCEHSSLTV